MKTIYVDNNATSQVDEAVLQEMLPFFRESYGNPSSMHTFGGNVAAHVTKARERVAALINAEPEEIVFTSCGTESDSTAIWATIRAKPIESEVLVGSSA